MEESYNCWYFLTSTVSLSSELFAIVCFLSFSLHAASLGHLSVKVHLHHRTPSTLFQSVSGALHYLVRDTLMRPLWLAVSALITAHFPCLQGCVHVRVKRSPRNSQRIVVYNAAMAAARRYIREPINFEREGDGIIKTNRDNL